MIIKEYYHNNNELYKVFLFETSNDLIIPFIKMIINPIIQNENISLNYISIKEGFLRKLLGKKDFMVISFYGDITNSKHNEIYKQIKTNIENIFNTKIKVVSSILEFSKVLNTVKRKYK